MRILQLHTRYRQPGGEDRAAETEAQLLRGAGHEVRRHRASNPKGPQAAVPFLLAPWNPAAARRLREAVEDFQPDVAHVHNTWFSMTPSVFAELQTAGVPVVVTLHNYRAICAAATLFRDGAPCTDCVGSHVGHAVIHRCYRASTVQSAVAATTIAVHKRRGTWHRHVDRFLALTEFVRQQHIAGGFPPERIEVKSNSVDEPGPRRLPPSASRTILFVGRLSAEKGVDTLLDAWARRSRQLELVVIGTGPMEASLRQRASSSVRFLGVKTPEKVAAQMASARALVFPSVSYEGQGLVALEAAAAGLPTVLSDLGAMSGLFAPHSRELLFPAGDADALGHRLDALEDAALVDAQGVIARRCYEERYTHDVALRHLERVYMDVAATARRRR